MTISDYYNDSTMPATVLLVRAPHKTVELTSDYPLKRAERRKVAKRAVEDSKKKRRSRSSGDEEVKMSKRQECADKTAG